MKTVSLSLAKKLQANGYPQDSYFWWHKVGDETQYTLLTQFSEIIREAFSKRDIAAPTADEILDKLPDYVKTKDRLDYWLYIGREDKNTWILYYEFTNKVVEMVLDKEERSYLKTVGTGKGNSLADACAECWLSLRRDKLL